MKKEKKENIFRFMYDHLGIILIVIVLISVIYLTNAFWMPFIVDIRHGTTPVNEISDNEKMELESSFLKIMEGFSSPAVRPYANQYYGSSTTSTGSSSQLSMDFTQVIDGTVRRIVHVSNLRDGWSSMYLLEILSNGKHILGLYAGNVDEIHVGDRILAEGVYVSGGEGFLLDWILPRDTTPFGFLSDLSTTFLFMAGFVLLWLIFNIRGFIKGKRHHILSISLFFLIITSCSLFTSACTIDMVTVVDEDGKGRVMTSFCGEQEKFDFVRQIPEMGEYIEKQILLFRANGGLVEDSIEDEEECLSIQKPFSGLGNISENGISQKESSGWVYTDMREIGGEKHFRYTALVDTTILYEVDNSINTTIQTEMNNEFDSILYRYSVVLPGEIIYHNADEIKGNKATWYIPMNDERAIVLESKVVSPTIEENVTGNTFIKVWQEYKEWIILGLVFIFASLLFVANKKKEKNEK